MNNRRHTFVDVAEMATVGTCTRSLKEDAEWALQPWPLAYGAQVYQTCDIQRTRFDTKPEEWNDLCFLEVVFSHVERVEDEEMVKSLQIYMNSSPEERKQMLEYYKLFCELVMEQS